MDVTETEHSQQDLARENARLRARIDALEGELLDVQRSANAAVARWQDRAYWLDRWHLDLNAVMRRPGAAEARAALRAGRSLVRFYQRLRAGLRRP
jgi:hypothetical protein